MTNAEVLFHCAATAEVPGRTAAHRFAEVQTIVSTARLGCTVASTIFLRQRSGWQRQGGSMLNRRTFCMVAATTFATSAAAQLAPRLVVVKAARMLDLGSGRYVPNAVVIITEGTVTASGSAISAPPGAQAIDLGDATILPGLIDVHTHLMARMGDNEDSYTQTLATESLARRALDGAADARATLMAGFTTVRDVESEGSGYADLDLRDAIDQELVDGPRMQAASRGIAMVGQYFPFGIAWDRPEFPTGAQMVSGVEEARRAAREQIGHGVDLLKVYADWEEPTLSVDELRAVVEEAHRFHRRVAAHATTQQGIANAIAAGVNSIEHGDHLTPKLLSLMKAKGIAWVTTKGRAWEESRRPHPPAVQTKIDRYVNMVRANLATAQRLGVTIASGFDPGSQKDHGRNAVELQALADLGLGNLGALRAATLGGAAVMGWSDKVGSLTPGHFGDVIAVRGDPLTDISVLGRVAFVMKGGSVIKDARQQG